MWSSQAQHQSVIAALQINTQNYCLLFPGKSKEAEIKRINKELANIRSKFKGNQFNLVDGATALVSTLVKVCTPDCEHVYPWFVLVLFLMLAAR